MYTAGYHPAHLNSVKKFWLPLSRSALAKHMCLRQFSRNSEEEEEFAYIVLTPTLDLYRLIKIHGIIKAY